MMEQDIVCVHRELQACICAVEKDETDKKVLALVKETFLTLFSMIKMIMISRQERYYGLFLMNFDLKLDFSLYCDACVSIDAFPFRMTVNPLLLGRKDLPEMIYILCHEIEHIVLNHPAETLRYNPQKDPITGLRLNIAMDASINDRLSADSKENKFNVIAEPKEAITPAYLRKEYRLHLKSLQAFDYYFERIPEPGFSGSKLPKIVFINKRSKNEIVTEKKRKGTVCLPHWTDSEDVEEVESLLRKFLSDICEGMSESMRSSLPEHQKEALRKLLSPPTITWKQLLKRYIGTIPWGHRKTRMRLSRRQPERYDLSGSINDRIIKLVVAIDTSGSMTVEILERIMTEIFAIIGARQNEVTVVECDAEIQRVYKATSVGELSYEIHGQGGTSFVPVIEYVNSSRYFRDAILIYFTDGMGDHSIPRPLTRRLLWVLHDDLCELSLHEPYGEVLVME